MARVSFGAGVIVGAAMVLFGFAALGLHADEVQAEVNEAAVLAHVSPVDLAGALVSQQQAGLTTDPYEYLRANGKLPPVALGAPPPKSTTSIWDRLAGCESSSNWHANTGNGFAGGLQFTPATWRMYGGVGSPASASREVQIAVAERVLAGQGWRAWPNCSRTLGLR
jgi:hypothetical protein